LYHRSDKVAFFLLVDDHVVYRTPPLGRMTDPQTEAARFTPFPLVESALYQAFAFCVLLRIPIVFESSDAGLSTSIFVSTLVRHLTGAFRRYPSLSDFMDPQTPRQFDLLLRVDNFSSVGLQRLTAAYQAEMLKFSILREFRVLSFRAYDDAFRREIDNWRGAVAPRARPVAPTIARTVVDRCHPKPFPEIGPTAQEKLRGSFPLLLRAAEIAGEVEKIKLPDNLVAIADIGQHASTLALASSISDALFVDGLPGAVRFSAPGKRKRMFVQLTTRDRDCVAANALVLATAMCIADLVVIPVAVPADGLIAPLRMAVQDFDRLMLVPGHLELQDWGRPKNVILVGRPGTRDLEGYAAESLIRTVLHPVITPTHRFTVRTSDDETPLVIYTLNIDQVREIIHKVCGRTAEKTAQDRGVPRAIATFVVANEFAEYLGLDD
jgi:hypothetical protein